MPDYTTPGFKNSGISKLRLRSKFWVTSRTTTLISMPDFRFLDATLTSSQTRNLYFTRHSYILLLSLFVYGEATLSHVTWVKTMRRFVLREDVKLFLKTLMCENSKSKKRATQMIHFKILTYRKNRY